MSEPITWAAVGMAAVSNVATWIMLLKAKKENGKLKDEIEYIPGRSKECIKRGIKLVEHQGALNTLIEATTEGKIERKEINIKLDQILIKVK